MKTLVTKMMVVALFLVPLAGCNDPVVGRWEGKDDSAVDLDIESGGPGYEGDGHIYLCSGDDCYLCPFDFEATSKGDGRFEVEGEFTGACSEVGSFEGIECEVKGDEMECELPNNGGTLEYERAD